MLPLSAPQHLIISTPIGDPPYKSFISVAVIVKSLKRFKLYDIMHNLKMSNETNKGDSNPASIFSLFEIPVEVHLQSSGGWRTYPTTPELSYFHCSDSLELRLPPLGPYCLPCLFSSLPSSSSPIILYSHTEAIPTLYWKRMNLNIRPYV